MKQVGGIAEVYLEKPGFVTLEYWCITKNSRFEAVSGAFFVIQEALTMIEMLMDTRGVTEEEINQCYYSF